MRAVAVEVFQSKCGIAEDAPAQIGMSRPNAGVIHIHEHAFAGQVAIIVGGDGVGAHPHAFA